MGMPVGRFSSMMASSDIPTGGSTHTHTHTHTHNSYVQMFRNWQVVGFHSKQVNNGRDCCC